MEFFKVMEKFDGGNFQLWKFKMRMMFSKHGFWKFVDGSAIILNDEDEMVEYNEKATKAFALFCEHLTNAQLAHIQYCENVKSVWETFCDVHEAKTIKNKLFFLKMVLHYQNARKGRLACAHQHGEGTCGSITFH
jgi:CRISPR/Cas system CSM-associated protein Csm2 small subunit